VQISPEPAPAPTLPANPTVQDLHAHYVANPNPMSLAGVVDALKPTIDYALTNVQAADDPFIKSRARVIAGHAVKSYSPEHGASLPTWVTQQLQQLHRIRRQSQAPIKLPDRSLLDAASIHRAEAIFMDRENREPDVHELADEVDMPVKRIEEVRRQTRRTPSPEALGDMPLSSGMVESDPYADEAVEYVYRDVDYTDRKILEMKTGYGGKYEPLEPADIATRLKLTPSQLSRRSAKLAMRIHDMHSMLKEVST
jgi:DNA-directed RNA polymerase specialized sigma subunit